MKRTRSQPWYFVPWPCRQFPGLRQSSATAWSSCPVTDLVKLEGPCFHHMPCITCCLKFWNSLDRYVFWNTMAFPTYDRYITYRYHMMPHPHTSCVVLSLFPLSLSLVLVEPRGLSLPHIVFQFLNLVASSHWDLRIGKHINNTTSVWMKTYQHDDKLRSSGFGLEMNFTLIITHDKPRPLTVCHCTLFSLPQQGHWDVHIKWVWAEIW